MLRRCLLLALGLTAGACGQDDRPPTWSYVHAAILEPNCTTSGCHSELVAVADIELTDRARAYELLVGAPCSDDGPGDDTRDYVDPGHPERSRLIHLLRGEDVAVPMPPDRFLPYRDVELVSAWILEGAPCD